MRAFVYVPDYVNGSVHALHAGLLDMQRFDMEGIMDLLRSVPIFEELSKQVCFYAKKTTAAPFSQSCVNDSPYQLGN